MSPPHVQSHYPSWRPPVSLPLVTTPEHPCPYRPGRVSRNRAFWADRLPPMLYHQFMDAGFRRSGKVIYQPACAGCRACLPIRVPVERFVQSKSHRRNWRRNQDLAFVADEPAATAEKFDLYRRYILHWHGREKAADEESYGDFARFLYDSPVDTLEFVYRDPAGRLLAVGIVDVCPASLSSVYFYFDPAHAARGLGTYGALVEIEHARRQGIAYYYLGYWVDQCPTMHYKASYHPHEVLHPDGVWRPSDRSASHTN